MKVRYAAVGGCLILGLGMTGCGELPGARPTHPRSVHAEAQAESSAFLLSSLDTLHQRELDDAAASKGKITHPQVKAYVQHVADDHALLLERSRQLRRELGLPEAPAGLPSPATDVPAAWTNASGPAADVAYLEHSIRLHEQALNTLDQSALDRDSPVKQHVTQARIVIETHRALMLDLQKMLFMTRYFSADAVPATSSPSHAKPGTNGVHPAK